MPRFLRGQFQAKAGIATHLSLTGLDNGFAILDVSHIGRYWNIGPQRSLHVPGGLLREGENELIDRWGDRRRSLCGNDGIIIFEKTVRHPNQRSITGGTHGNHSSKGQRNTPQPGEKTAGICPLCRKRHHSEQLLFSNFTNEVITPRLRCESNGEKSIGKEKKVNRQNMQNRAT